MRKSIVLAACLTVATPALGQSSHYVRGYVTKNGTYVAPHYQTNPDSSLLNNWSTKGNYNPYTGQAGTKNPYASPYTYSYGSQRSSSSSSYGSGSLGSYGSGDSDDSESDPH